MQRFLLLASPRTGSTSVLRTLQQHPAIVAERELLHAPDWRGFNRRWLRLWRRWPALMLPLRAAWQLRRHRRSIYGVSLFPQHVQRFVPMTGQLRRAGWLVFTLQRDSLFDQTISYAVAEQTLRRHRGRTQSRDVPSLTIDAERFVHEARWLQRQRALVAQLAAAADERIVYEHDPACRRSRRCLIVSSCGWGCRRSRCSRCTAKRGKRRTAR
jgi:hypothetical protein